MSNPEARSSSPLLPVLVVVVAGGLAYWLWPRGAGDDPDGGGEGAAAISASTRGGGGGPSGSGLRAKELLGGRDELLVAAKAALRGTVRDPEGAPIAGAQVCASPSSATLLRSETREPFCATTEADGTYRIAELFPVEHSVSASAPTYIPKQFTEGEGRRKRRSVQLLAGAERAGVDLVLKPGGVEIRGVVRDLSGGVLEGALVSSGGGSTRSDEDGRFALWVEPGATFVRARADGYASNSDRGAAPGHEFELFLTPESVLIGKVVDASSGAPVAGVSVNSSSWGARFNWGRGPDAVTDAGGNFRIDGLEPGAYKPTAFDDEHYGVAAAQVLLGLGQTSEPVTVEVHPALTIAGAIVPEDGEVCDAGSVSLTDAASKRTFSSSTESDGSVRLRGVLPGTYDVDVNCDGYVPEERYEPISVEEATSGLEWSVAVGQAILGQVVTAQGEPAPSMRVRATMKVDAADPRARQTSSWGVATEDDGSFAIYGLKPGTYELGISGERPGPDAPVEVEVPKGRDVDDLKVELPGSGTVTGRVVDERGAPVGDVTVNLRSKDRGGGSIFFFSGRSSSSARTTDDGNFTIEHVRPGSYRAEASQGWTSTLRSPGTSDDDVQGVELSVGEDEATQIELRVEAKGAEIRGKVVDADGGPVSDAFISATRESDSATKSAGSNVRASRWGSWDRQPVLTDSDGSFTVSNLTVGTYTVQARRKGGGEGFAEGVATDRDGEAVITIESTGSLGGTVTASAGPPEEFTVTLRDRASGVWRSDTFFRTGGAFSFDALSAGDYEITVEAGEGSAKAEESLGDGEARDDVKIELASRITVRGRLVDLDSGEPIAGMRVSVGPPSGGMFFGGGRGGERKEVSDANGDFEVANAPSGEVMVRISPQSWGGTNDYSGTSVMRTLTAKPAAQEIGEITLVKKRVTDQEKVGDLGYKLRETAPEEDWAKRELKVAFVRPGGPAAAAGLKAGDVITAVNGHDVTGEATYKYGALTRAKVGDTVTLGLASGSSVKVVLGPAI